MFNMLKSLCGPSLISRQQCTIIIFTYSTRSHLVGLCNIERGLNYKGTNIFLQSITRLWSTYNRFLEGWRITSCIRWSIFCSEEYGNDSLINYQNDQPLPLLYNCRKIFETAQKKSFLDWLPSMKFC
jgi:hypothetical protein